MKRLQLRWALVVLLGALLEPFGHQISYSIRFGVFGALAVQSQGSHAYFPRVASVSTITLMVGLTLALLTVAVVRLSLGHRHVAVADWQRTFLALAATQCALFGVQETLETLARQASPDFVLIGILAVCGQLPVAALGAWIVARLHGYLALAPEAIRVLLTVPLGRYPGPIPLLAVTIPAGRPRVHSQRWSQRRGPPSSI